jgi:hypothetical protein
VAQIKYDNMSFTLKDVPKPSRSANVCCAARGENSFTDICTQIIDIKIDTEQEISGDIPFV